MIEIKVESTRGKQGPGNHFLTGGADKQGKKGPHIEAGVVLGSSQA